jgi:hypothetical protein
MDAPAFARRRTDLVWTSRARRGRTLLARTPDVTITAQAAWYARSRWTVTSVSSLALPIDTALFVSKSGGAHGYWRNTAPGLSGYFGYCDLPALMPLLVGPRTRAALLAHDSPSWSSAPPSYDTRAAVELHIRDRTVETRTRTYDVDSTVLDDQIAIHHALAADQEALLASWRKAADELHGMVSDPWPPLLTIPRAFGATMIGLRWPSAGLGNATIDFSADARGAKLWLIEREPQPTPKCLVLADRPFLAVGEPTIALDKLARIVARTELLSINVRRHVTVRIAQYTPDPALLDAILELIGEICGAGADPYR